MTSPEDRAAEDLAACNFIEHGDIERVAAILTHHKNPDPPEPGEGARELETYDCGLLDSIRDSSVIWWHDYIRGELARAHEFYSEQYDALLATCDSLRHLVSTPEEGAQAAAEEHHPMPEEPIKGGDTFNYRYSLKYWEQACEQQKIKQDKLTAIIGRHCGDLGEFMQSEKWRSAWSLRRVAGAYLVFNCRNPIEVIASGHTALAAVQAAMGGK